MNWLPVVGYEGLYEVSDEGSVRSLSRKTLGRWGNMKTTPGRVLNLGDHPTGYIRVSLSRQGKSQHKLVHRLVAEAFIPKIQGKNCVNHKDSDRSNNVVSNLEWCTHSENTQHALAKGNIYFRPRPKKVTCIRGHKRTEDNVDAKGTCKDCKWLHHVQRQALKKIKERYECKR